MKPDSPDEITPTWRTYLGKRVVIHALDKSYAARRAPIVVREAERAIEELAKLFELPADPRAVPIAIYLTDPIASSSPEFAHQGQTANEYNRLVNSVGGQAIVRVVRPEDPGDSLVLPLTQFFAFRWISPNARNAPFFLSGVANVIAARIGSERSLQEVNTAVQTELAAGRSVSIFPYVKEQSDRPGTLSSDIATSFVAFLVDTFGGKALSQFLASCDPQRQDLAATTAFRQPLGSLEGAWLSRLRSPAASGAAISNFLRRITPFARPYWQLQSEILLYVVLGVAYTVALPLAAKYLIDTIIPHGNLQTLLFFCLALAGLFVFNAYITLRRIRRTGLIVQSILLELQKGVFTHLQQLPHAFYAETRVGDLVSRFSNDIQTIQLALVQSIGTGILVILNLVAAAIVLFLLSPLIGVLVVIFIPLLALSYVFLAKRFEKASTERQKLSGEIVVAVQENLSAQPVIKALGLEQSSIAAYHTLLQLMVKFSGRLTRITAQFEASLVLATAVGQLTVLGVGGYLVMRGYLTFGTILAAWGLLPSLFNPIATLASIVESIQAASGSMNRLVELLDHPVTIYDWPGVVALPPLKQGIQLENVSFGYGGEHPVLSFLNLAIPAGSHVAIVGPSGSGKSTLVNLLLRFWDPEQGRILFDGNDLRGVTLASLRGQIGLVFQDTFIFDTTVRENIAMGRLGASDSEISAAARGAGLESYINTLPAGYDTVLGERGVRLSGGQRQRLAIARVLLRNPRILILDEAASALDAQTEREILGTLDKLKQGRTTITITYRLSSVVKADRIFVLEQGQLVEQGTHDELLKAGGLYQRLYKEQVEIAGAVGTVLTGIELARLRKIPLFAEVSNQLLEKIAERLKRELYAVGEDVVRQGQPGDKLYIIHAGQAEVLLQDRGGERRINTLDEGDFFGEMALLAEEPGSATVRTTVPTEFYSLAKADFLSLLQYEPAIRNVVLKISASRRAALASTHRFLESPPLAGSLMANAPMSLLGMEQLVQQLPHPRKEQ